MLDLVRQSILTPRGAAERLLALGLPPRVGLEALALVAALSGVLVGLISGGRLEIVTPSGTVVLSPLTYALTLFAALGLGGVALAWAGRALNGRGTVPEALSLVAWLQVVDLVVQAGAVVVALLVPPLAPVAALVAFGVLVWCLLGFVQALHDVSAGKAAGIALLAAVGLLVGLTILVGFLGLGVAPDV